jgi:SAM-dependent methyltransferase
MGKRNNWFRNYQQIPGVVAGTRKLDIRTKGYVEQDFKGSTVLDLGCNIGQMCHYANDCGAKSVLGVEFDSNAFNLACKYRGDKSSISYTLDDLDNPFFWTQIPVHDVVMLLSVIDTKELTNRSGILAKAAMRTGKVFYFEGHMKRHISTYLNDLLNLTDFNTIEHVGRNGGRDLIRCTREGLDTQGFYDKIADVTQSYNRIAVVGMARSGKSTLRKGLTVPEGFTVMDDCSNLAKIGATKKLILFDYKAALYADDFDVIFNVNLPFSQIEVKRPNLPWQRSPQMKNSKASKFLRAIYNVHTYE